MRKILALLCVVALAGCGDGLNRQPVKGTVTFKGKPVVIGSATFMPAGEGGRTNISATIRNGQYEVPKENGLSPGKYRVRFSAFDKEVMGPTVPGTGPTPDPPKEILPPKHSTDSKHEVEVKAGQPNQFDFNLD